jgi:hypothetical protein
MVLFKKIFIHKSIQKRLKMVRTKFILLLIAGLIISSGLTWAASPQDYTISYTFKNPDGTAFRIIKYYLLEGDKFRIEYFTIPVEYNVSASVEGELNLDSATVKEEAKVKIDVSDNAESQAKDLSNIEMTTFEILRKDKNIVWSALSLEYKIYSESPLSQDSWERAVTKLLINSFPDLKKTGETKLLNYPCDIYENVQKVQENTWTTIIIAAQDLDVVLKTESWRNGKLVETMEATEFSMEKPAASLFEVPDGYQKNE